MNHYDEEILVKYELELLDEPAQKNIETHLDICNSCSTRYNKIKKEIETIGKFDMDISLEPPIVPISKRKKSFWVKSAAAILLGFSIGYLSQDYFTKDKITVVGQTFVPHNNLTDSLKLFFCESVDTRGFM
jgi:hypothetical protein